MIEEMSLTSSSESESSCLWRLVCLSSWQVKKVTQGRITTYDYQKGIKAKKKKKKIV